MKQLIEISLEKEWSSTPNNTKALPYDIAQAAKKIGVYDHELEWLPKDVILAINKHKKSKTDAYLVHNKIGVHFQLNTANEYGYTKAIQYA